MISWSGFKNNPVKAALKSTLLWSTPGIAYAAGHSRRGELLPEIVSKSATTIGVPVLATAIGALTGNPLLGLALGLLPTERLNRKLFGATRFLTQLETNARHLETGGSYRDTETAAALRFRSMSEMSGSMGASRRFLGNEAAILAGQE